MTRKLTFLILALFALISGPGWGQTGYTIDFANNASSATAISSSTNASTVISANSRDYVTTKPFTVNSGNCYYGDTKTCIRTGKTGTSASLSIALSETGKVSPTSIIVHAYATGNKNIGYPFTINGVTEANEKVTSEDAEDFTFNFTLTENIENITIASEKAVYINSITVIYQSAPAATLESIEVSGEAADLWTADAFSHEGITVMANWDEGDPTDVTNACEYSGYDMTSAGEQTVTVSYTAGEVTKSDTYTVTVNTIGNTQDEPYTVAQAKALIDAGNGLNEEVYVEGIICQVDSYNSTYHSITYWISADGTTTDKFEVYGGLNAEDQDPFSSKDDLTVGYSAIVKGTIQKFNSTYEFSQNSRLVSYTPPVTQLPAPTNLNASNLSMNGATLSWDAVEHASSYTVYVTGINYEETFEPTTNSIVLDGLTPGTTYLWTVKAIGDEVTYLDSDESELADFTTPTTVIYNINFEAQQTGGTIEIYPEQAAAGEEVIAIATAANHYSFTQWNFSPEVTILADGEITYYNIIFTMPASDVTVSATFTEDLKYTVTYAKGGDDVTGEDPEPVSYYENDEVTLEENPYTRTGYTFFKWEVKDADENTQYLDENATFVMPASYVTVTPYWDEKDQYTVTYKSLGETIATEQVYEGDLCTNVPTVTNIPTGWTIFGWTTGSANQTTTAPEPFDPTTNPVIEDIILNAVFTKTEGETSWDETELADLTSSDVFVMVGANNKFLQNNNNSGVDAVVVNGQVTTTIIDDYKWNATEETNGYVFNANGRTDVLYFTNDNNGVKFGTPQNTSSKYFTQNDNNYLVGTDGTNTRYLSYYVNGSNWRCYKNTDNNPIAMKFYKLNAGTTYYTTVAPASEYAIAIDESIEHGTIEVENGLTAAAAGTEITLIVTPAEHYSLTPNSLTVTRESSATVEVTPVPGEVIKYTFVMPAEAVTITAQFTENPKFTVSCYANGTSVSTEQVYAGVMQLPVSVTAPNGYTFVGWTNQQISGVAESATYFSSYNVTGNVDLYAVFAIAIGGGTSSVTKDIIAEAGVTSSVTLNATAYQIGNLPIQLTATKGTTNWPVINYNPTYGNDLRFYKASSSVTFSTTNNQSITKIEFKKDESTASDLRTYFSANVGTLSTNVWTGSANSVTISFSNNDNFKEQMYIINVTYSETSPSTYSNFCTTVNALYGNLAGATTEADKAYYISAAANVPANATATINGVLGNADASLLIIEDGAQLIQNSSNVKATVQKSITGYTGDNDNYYLIANPTDNTTVANLINPEGYYDLYTFNPAQALEWNYEKERNTLTSGIGYLYANKATTTLEFVGALTPAGSSDIELTYADAGTGIDFPGFNLIGNPFACNAYIDGSFYRMNGTEFVSVANGPISPCEGIFVEALEDGEELAITTTAASKGANLELAISQGRSAVIDRAIVRFDESNDMHKFMMNPAHTNLSIAKGSETFAAISTEAEGELPVNFKAEKNGTYTITVNTKNVDAEYLHLIDNMTGMDVDLLSTPSYTFDAKTSDYASRFKLVFGVKNEASESSDSNFAFMSNGNLVIDNIEGEATLQIVDELGRVISTETVSGSYNKALNLKAGLYIINLNGMTQKIVVK